MLNFLRILLLLLIFSSTPTSLANDQLQPAVTQPIPVADIVGFADYPPFVKKLIRNATSLSQKNLTYLYGSADPKNKGMDCSGTIYYLLTSNDVKNVPRSADEMYQWVKNIGTLNQVHTNDFNSTEFANLKPGDLLFWSGTYDKGNSNTITHVMLYLGENTKHARLMFGASDGRTYQNKKMWGVSVFDFKLPAKEDTAKFVGYSRIPLTAKTVKPVSSVITLHK